MEKSYPPENFLLGFKSRGNARSIVQQKSDRIRSCDHDHPFTGEGRAANLGASANPDSSPGAGLVATGIELRLCY